MRCVNRGMTLIEVLVTMTILVLFLAVGFPGYQRATQEREVQRVALQIKDAINDARQLAMAPINSTGNPVQYYCFNIQARQGGGWFVNEYSTLPSLTDPTSIACPSSTSSNISKSGQAPANITINVSGVPAWKAFLTHRYPNGITGDASGGGIGEMSSSTPMMITVTRTLFGGNRIQSLVTVNAEGVVDVTNI